jgi:hypothetical protein
VELWLATQREAAAAVEDHRQVLRAVAASAPAEPTEVEWAAVLKRIESELPPPRMAPRAVVSRWAGVLAAAAAAALLVFIPGDFSSWRPGAGASLLPEAPFLLASPEDVEIVSIDAADLKSLIVGQPPWRGPLVLAGAGDVELHFAEAGESGWVPGVSEDETAAPMYIVPMRSESSDRP